MRIRVHTVDTLTHLLPGDGDDDEATIDVAEGATPNDVLATLGIAPEQNYLLVLNDRVVPKVERASRQLSEGDELSILIPLKGG
ncbi:MAG: MoaD/ThiS family protein [Hyphomicrobiaceae bacterium]